MDGKHRPWKLRGQFTQTVKILVGTNHNHFSRMADRRRWCQLSWIVSVVLITSLSHWPSTSVYSMVSMSHCIALVCQRQRWLVYKSDTALFCCCCFRLSLCIMLIWTFKKYFQVTVEAWVRDIPHILVPVMLGIRKVTRLELHRWRQRNVIQRMTIQHLWRILRLISRTISRMLAHLQLQCLQTRCIM